MSKKAPLEQVPKTISFNYPDSLVQMLGQFGITLVISTYQSGKILLVGQDDNKLDIRYKDFLRPMGMAAQGSNLWAGLGHGIWHFQNLATAAPLVDKEKKFTACYLPFNIHFTGDVDIHEMAFSDQLYFINTKFSCLCVNDKVNSFVPVWKPPFITDLSPVDKCHLNGLGMRDERPRYVTMLGKTDAPLGWREHKADGGMIMDIDTNEILADGLSMPHSPRWHQDAIWFLESGKGAMCRLDPVTGEVVEKARVPGFTRGFHLVNDIAFVGVSKVRESATFSGLPVTRLSRRICGVWVVDINTGKELTYIEFTGGVDEIFSVCVLPHKMMELADFQNPLTRGNYQVPDTELGPVRMPETPPEVAAPHFEQGNDLFNQGKKEAAIEEFQKALDIQPDLLPATFNMAVALGDLGRFNQAEKILLDVVEKDAAIVEAYNSLGYVYYKKGDFAKARTSFEQTLDLNPEYQQARNSLDALKKEMAGSQE
jgi:uncharacterized protein (TIGR03032 family)